MKLQINVPFARRLCFIVDVSAILRVVDCVSKSRVVRGFSSCNPKSRTKVAYNSKKYAFSDNAVLPHCRFVYSWRCRLYCLVCTREMNQRQKCSNLSKCHSVWQHICQTNILFIMLCLSDLIEFHVCSYCNL